MSSITLLQKRQFICCTKECNPLNDLPRRNPTPDLSLGFKWTPTEASSLSYLGITSAPAMKAYARDQVLRSVTGP